MEYDGQTKHNFRLSTDPDSEDNDMSGSLKCANIFYVIVFVIFAFICFILYGTGNTWLGKIISTKKSGKAPIGVECVARTTCPLALWFAIHSIIMIGNPNIQNSLQTVLHCRFLFVHVLILLALWAAFLFVPDNFTRFYMEFAIYASAVYILFQIFFLVDFFNMINEKLCNDENYCLPSTITIILGVGSLTAFGVSYYIFYDKGCSTNLGILITNMICCIILFLLAAFIEHGSIFTASLICAYCAYLTVAGCMCQTSCNRISSSSQGVGFTIAASVFTLIWCGYSAFSSTSQFSACDCTECCGCDENNSCCPETCCGAERTKEKTFSLSFFHFLFALASIYLTMIVTHWGKTDEASSWTTDRGTIARWVNYSSSWVVMLLYLWTLIAPLLFPDRDFS